MNRLVYVFLRLLLILQTLFNKQISTLMSDDSTDSDSFHSCDDDNSECETKSELSIAERRKLIEEASKHQRART